MRCWNSHEESKTWRERKSVSGSNSRVFRLPILRGYAAGPHQANAPLDLQHKTPLHGTRFSVDRELRRGENGFTRKCNEAPSNGE